MKKNLARVLYDIGHFFYLKNLIPLARIATCLNNLLCSCAIPPAAQIHKTVQFGRNGIGIVMMPNVAIDEETIIAQNVTIGAKGNHLDKKTPAAYRPVTAIGKRCYIGAGACIIGEGISIGDDVVVGANAVVLKDVPSGTIVAGVPAKAISRAQGYKDE